MRRVLRGETVSIDGRRHECWVVETNIDGAVVSMPEVGVAETKIDGTLTAWIDKMLVLTLQSDGTFLTKVAGKETATVRTRMTTQSLKINEPIPASVFDVTPPANTTRVSADSLLSSAGVVVTQALVGKTAPPFELKGADGKAYKLANFRGRVVILDFWATWCGPCRASIPTVDDFYQKNNDRDVVVLGVNVGEEADVVNRFVAANAVHYPVLLNPGSDVASSYKVEVYPTVVVIGRDGKVRSCELGFPGAGALKKLLTTAMKN
jgi:thiol-disulfide isomerase/thioredoxin